MNLVYQIGRFIRRIFDFGPMKEASIDQVEV
jgi:hypothetical protein